jgi:hypothetical protein
MKTDAGVESWRGMRSSWSRGARCGTRSLRSRGGATTTDGAGNGSLAGREMAQLGCRFRHRDGETGLAGQSN